MAYHAKIAKAARDYQKGLWVKYRPNGWNRQVKYEANGTIWEALEDGKRNQFGDLIVPNFDQWKTDQELTERLKSAGAILVPVNVDGIKQVTVDNAGLVSSIEFSTGESLARVRDKRLLGDRLPNGRGSVNTCKHAVAILSRAREQAVYCLYQQPVRAEFECSRGLELDSSRHNVSVLLRQVQDGSVACKPRDSRF